MSAEQTPTLGVIAISYNEERDLPGFLNHLVPWVDEVIIIDDGSTDRTEAIATEAGRKVTFVKQPRAEGEFYSHQRNKGIAAARSDWLLHMDIDERVTPRLAREIVEAISRDDKDGYRYRRLNYFMHRPMKGGGWNDWNLIHLARREKFKFGGMFHEDCILDASPERVGQLSGRMIHFNEANFEQRIRKSTVYMEEVAAGVAGRANPVRWYDLVGRPLVEFSRKYFLKRGFLDGTPGFISAAHSATAIFRANALVWDRQNQIERDDLENEIKEQWCSFNLAQDNDTQSQAANS